MATLTYPMARRTGKTARSGEASRDFGFEYRRHVGDYIVKNRIARGLTQFQLGHALGMRDTAISAIELGRNSVPPERAEKLAEVLALDKKAFAKFLLQHSNPWLFSMLWPDELPRNAIGQIPERITDQRVNNV
jgi:transcriptional regulator with XRE-family HTH domain